MTPMAQPALHDTCDAERNALVSEILSFARERGLTLGTAESCTGGLVAAALTDVAGSSDVFRGGVVSYWEEVKTDVLGVSADVIENDGVVSAACAEQMAAGACKVIGCDVAVSTTGIAGPGGGSPDKPVGTVWVGLAAKGRTQSTLLTLEGSRAQIREDAVSAALQNFFEFLKRVA